MNTVQAGVVILQDDVAELVNQDSLTDLRLITLEEAVAGNTCIPFVGMLLLYPKIYHPI